MYDKRERNYRSAKKEPMVMGPMSQWIENPLGKTKDLDGEIRQLEDRFGLSPMARLKLGITFLDHQKSLQEMNADYNANVDPPPEDDPRAEIAPDAGAKSRQIH